MINFSLIFTFLLFGLNIKAQESSIDCIETIIKVKPIKPNPYLSCKETDKEIAYVLEFEVIGLENQKKYGAKIYAITPCIDFPNESFFNEKYVWDLTISECKYYKWNIKILNKELLDLNINKKQYWNLDLAIKKICY